MRYSWWIFGLAALPYAALPLVQKPTKKVDFGRDVAPIFKGRCASCHSGTNAAGDLDLSTAKGILKGGATGPFVDPKHPEQSQLLRRIQGLDNKEPMPMGFAPLPKGQIALLRQWIVEGASTATSGAKHWAYVPPKKSVLPDGTATNPIDRFIQSRLKREGLKPAAPATKEQLLRRVSLDLIGLPPTVREVEAFLADARPDAYERVVDRLLSSPQYGERQARLWLDLARYADSDGYEKDLNRSAWKYRDWVINAFNQNTPYDRFTIEQIAGDLLPNPTQDQMIATGFHRNTMMNLEGGVDQEEAHFNVVVDRVGTTGTVWLGSTVACARCHDHKYDPFSQKDFYKLAAYFGNAKIYPRGPKEVGEEKWFERQMEVPNVAQVSELNRLNAERDTARKTLLDPSRQNGFEKWRTEMQKGTDWVLFSPAQSHAESKAVLTKESDGSIYVTGDNPDRDTYKLIGTTGLKSVSGLSIDALEEGRLRMKGPGRAENGNFVLTNVKLLVNGANVPLTEGNADFVQSGYRIVNGLGGNESKAWAVVPNTGRSHTLTLKTSQPFVVPAGAEIKVILEQQSPWAQHNLGRFRVRLTDSEFPLLAVAPPSIRQRLHDPSDPVVREYYGNLAPELKSVRDKIKTLDEQIASLKKMIPTALVMEDKPASGPLTTYVRTRGEFLQKAELVRAGVPQFLPPLPSASPSNRLGLARWLVSRENPLTARVQINRMWELLFGRGLVDTSEDFGTQGSRPSHPELLDWLAVDFMDKKWDMKAMYRLMVTSSTYRQASATNARLLQRDPQNVLLARGPRFRLEAEAIRDTALRAAGLLDLSLGGPSVMPAQPEGVWDTPYNGEKWVPSSGKNAFRRGIYTFLKRTSPYPSFLAFDATSRESCTVRRIRTNTPLQALAMMNDEAILVAARSLGKRMATADSPEQGLRYGFIACTGRRPSSAEISRLRLLSARLLKTYAASPDLAKRLAGTPEIAAWTMVANVLLNLDETLTKS